MNRGAWKVAVHGVAEGQTGLSYFTFTFHFYSLEKEMATHPTVLAKRIPEMGKPSGLPSVGSHRVGTAKEITQKRKRQPTEKGKIVETMQSTRA